MLSPQETRLLTALEGHAAQRGVEIVTIAIVGAKRQPTIRVYIDTPEGVGFDELTAAQSWIGDVIEAIDPFPGAYRLEVSSPGIDRPLRTLEHFARFAGERATVKTSTPIEGRKTFTGTLEAPEAENVVLSDGDTRFFIPHDAIAAAHLIGTVDFSS